MPEMASSFWSGVVGVAVRCVVGLQFVLFLCGSLVQAEILVIDLNSNGTADIISDMPASFGNRVPVHGVKGRLVVAHPKTGCGPAIHQAPKPIDNYGWIVLILRGGCPFVEKVLNAQFANYSAAIIYNIDGDDDVTKMGGHKHAQLAGFQAAIVYNYPGDNKLIKMPGNGSEVTIPSTFIANSDGMDLLIRYMYPRHKEFLVEIKEQEEVDYRIYLLPFAIVVGVCFFMVMVFLIVKFIRDHNRTRVARLSKKHLKKIPIRKFKKGQYYDTCAICLDEYEEGEKIRVLPCEHAYHAKCIDPWLTKNKKTCPVCKRRVIPGRDPNSETSDSDSDGPSTSQTTPLLMNSSSGHRSHGSMNQVEADSRPTPRAQSAPPLFEATVVMEEEGGAVGGVGISHTHNSHDGGPSTSQGGRGGGSRGKGRRKREEEDRLLMATEEDEEEEELRKAERKERRRKKKEKKRKAKKSGGAGGETVVGANFDGSASGFRASGSGVGNSIGVGSVGEGGREREQLGMDGGCPASLGAVSDVVPLVEPGMGVDDRNDDVSVKVGGGPQDGVSEMPCLGAIGSDGIGPITDEDDYGGGRRGRAVVQGGADGGASIGGSGSNGGVGGGRGGTVNTAFSDSQEEVVVANANTRRGKKREMSEVV